MEKSDIEREKELEKNMEIVQQLDKLMLELKKNYDDAMINLAECRFRNPMQSDFVGSNFLKVRPSITRVEEDNQEQYQLVKDKNNEYLLEDDLDDLDMEPQETNKGKEGSNDQGQNQNVSEIISVQEIFGVNTSNFLLESAQKKFNRVLQNCVQMALSLIHI
eukprot:TRINITY_DN6906_c0_g1_i1.p2 TRINITY_DN6906_c0_g1~~TRINITY_DN6906_c0_g1_i1.p2  ORF type:complete len:162 (-),score=38.74 TRINITY_DN6906_c0_g1_i1:2-487(-)